MQLDSANDRANANWGPASLQDEAGNPIRVIPLGYDEAAMPNYGGGGGGGGRGPMEPTIPFREYVDKADEAVEARTDTKFAELLGEIRGLTTGVATLTTSVSSLRDDVKKVDDHARSARSTVIAAVVGTGIAVAGLAYAGVQIFQGGMGATANAYSAGLAVASVKPPPSK